MKKLIVLILILLPLVGLESKVWAQTAGESGFSVDTLLSSIEIAGVFEGEEDYVFYSSFCINWNKNSSILLYSAVMPPAQGNEKTSEAGFGLSGRLFVDKGIQMRVAGYLSLLKGEDYLVFSPGIRVIQGRCSLEGIISYYHPFNFGIHQVSIFPKCFFKINEYWSLGLWGRFSKEIDPEGTWINLGGILFEGSFLGETFVNKIQIGPLVRKYGKDYDIVFFISFVNEIF